VYLQLLDYYNILYIFLLNQFFSDLINFSATRYFYIIFLQIALEN